ncbi:MAG: cytidylate kinase-like family protein [Dehalococcoidia bacterium]
MSVITITGHLGSMGGVAGRVADAMGYQLVDRELVAAAAEIMGQPERDLLALDERTGSFVDRVIDVLQRMGAASMTAGEAAGAFDMTYANAAGASTTAGERYFETLRTVMERLADEGNIVIVGRGGQGILAGRADTFHARVICAQDERIRRIAARDDMTIEASRARIEESDHQREAWHQRYLGIDYRSPYHYGLVVNTGVLTDRVAADLIVRGARASLEAPAAAHA